MNDAEIIQVTEHTENLAEHIHKPMEKKHALRQRDLDQQYKQCLPKLMKDVEDRLARPFRYPPAETQMMKKTAVNLRKDRDASLGYSKHYEKLAKETLREPTLKSCCFARVALQLLDSPTAHSVTDEAAPRVRSTLLARLSSSASNGRRVPTSRSVTLDLVKEPLSSRRSASRTCPPLLHAHPLSSKGTAENCSPKLAELVTCLAPLAAQERPLLGIVFVQTRASARRVVNFIVRAILN